MSALSKMITLATTLHDGQFDKGGKPYILHPLAVMQDLAVRGYDESILAIAVGHDIIEDTIFTFEDLKLEGIPIRVIAGIRRLTKTAGQSYEDYKATVMKDRDSIVVKMADLRHNMDINRLETVTDKDIARVVRYHAFYRELEDRLAGIMENERKLL